MKKLYILLLGIFLCHISFAQIHFDITDEVGDAGNEVSIDVHVTDFIDVASCQFSINWDPDVASFSSIENISTDLAELDIEDFGTPEQPAIDPGELAVIWNPSNTQNATIEEDNHLLFTLVLTLIGSECETSVVNLSGTPRSIEFANSDGETYDVTSNDGSVEINGTNCGGGSDLIELTISNESTTSGGSVCVEVLVDGFFEIVNAEIGVLWDGDELTNATLENSALVGGQPVPADGSLRFLWQAPNLENPLTLDDGTKLFDLCYDVIAPSGTESCITIGDIETPTSFETSFSNFDEEIIPYTVQDGCVQVQGGSTDVTFFYDDQELILGSNVCIPIKARNFNDIASFQFAMEFDETILTYTGTGFLNPSLPIFDDYFALIEPGILAVFWNDPSTNGVDLPGEPVLYEICFDVAGDCDETTEIEFTGANNGGIEVTNGNVETIPYVFESNTLTVICPCDVNIVASQTNNVSCNGGDDGKITVIADGGNGNYTYTWDNGESGAMISGLIAGDYTVSVSDGEACNTSQTFSISQPNAITVGGTVVDESANCDGSITLVVNGGTVQYSFMWNDGVIDGNRTALCKGDYSVTVTDANNCTQSQSFTVEPAPLQIADVTINDVSCNGGSDGSIELDVIGGCAPYTFSPSLTDLSAGTYEVTITDASTPPIEIVQSYPVGQPSAILITLDNIQDTDASINGAIDVTVTGGTGPYTYSWSPSGQDTEDISGLESGDYTLVVTDDNGCVVSSSEFAVGSSVILVNLNLMDFNGFSNDCAGECNGSVTADVLAANGDVSYTLDAAPVSLPLSDLCAGTYTLGYQDENGLMGAQEFTITEPDALLIDVEVISECGKVADGEVLVTVTGGVEDYGYEYSGSNETTENPVMLENGANTVVVTDNNNCQVSAQFEIEPCEDDTECYNGSPILTPNSDGSNDLFVISCLNNPDNTLYIYDRFGRTVYTQSNYDNSWGGVDINGNDLQENGYMWVLEVISSEGIREVYKGTVTVLRTSY